MNWLCSLLHRFRALILRRYRLVRVQELPDRLKSRRVYAEAEGVDLWFATMLCPEGCGESIHLSLVPGDYPRWHLIEHSDGTVSLQPSVWRTKGCRSHFVLQRGRVLWCHESTS